VSFDVPEGRAHMVHSTQYAAARSAAQEHMQKSIGWPQPQASATKHGLLNSAVPLLFLIARTALLQTAVHLQLETRHYLHSCAAGAWFALLPLSSAQPTGLHSCAAVWVSLQRCLVAWVELGFGKWRCNAARSMDVGIEGNRSSSHVTYLSVRSSARNDLRYSMTSAQSA
jgi:hypothetical protein